ncbi:extracellular solute-binding protein [Jatrophihabitans telluris]|uniref:Extracellular solute-binding protein n=1 Tax=Jatrophihabitans telluris TaxID=2038343 RepID=A0ABY4QZF7_9ACTN|nr:sugar ABC transporter substrate-binding protein [Jatrophihabitans telluris]UQX88231.1 extracellular solute-binding protein [Jatrophihabitans telluris]
MDLSRRGFLAGSAGAATLLGLSACTSVHSNSGTTDATVKASGSTGAKSSLGPQTGQLTFAFWGGSTGETAGFNYVKQKFEAANPGAKITLKVVPYDGFFAGIDRGIQAGNAPDIFRVDYTTMGKYSSAGALMDLTQYFSSSDIDAFLPALWDAIKYQNIPFGVPHQTDCTAIVYDKDAFASAGITSVPDSLANAWSWDEFSQVATKLRSALPASKFPFAYDWTKAGAYRWLSFLYQAGGSLLTPDLKKSALPSAAGTKALDFTKSFFTNKWVPASNTIKGAKYSDEFFLGKTVPMTFIGDFLVPEIADPKSGYKGNWGVTFMPKDTAAATDLGGNAIVANKATKNPDLAAAFLKFIVSEDSMKYFCEQAIELPTLKSLASSSLSYATAPDAVKVFAQQATTLSQTITTETSVPAFSKINTLLQDQLELAFNGQATAKTLQAIADGVNTSIGS